MELCKNIIERKRTCCNGDELGGVMRVRAVVSRRQLVQFLEAIATIGDRTKLQLKKKICCLHEQKEQQTTRWRPALHSIPEED
ncbi:hypothetical protein MA16_Dca009721 [Dendrobium catenatum]|uniref:Uncharacterized protein n=1 Tax=Dendrobium catenatum TaxID=906689 RepID=A0A2I0VQJ5_9ASPA|nr:hypothetical protein MA16_Dca009721 [Dendrobium catenatum]